MRKYRGAILGCGRRANMHGWAYQQTSRAELVACCDLVPERREQFAGEFGIRAYADAAAMIREEQPDLVHIVTLPTVRVDVMTLVSDLGVPACIVEKPVAYEVRDWKALRKLEAESKTKFGVSAQFRYHPDLIRCREALQSGRLGDTLFIDASAGGNVADQGVHVIDWAMSLNGDSPVVRVFGAASGASMLTGRIPGPETSVAQLLFANGVRALWHLGSSAPRVSASEGYHVHCRVAAYAERGRTLYEEFRGWEIVSPEGTERGETGGSAGWKASNLRAQANLADAMLDWLEDDARPVGTNLKRSLEQWNAVLGLYASVVYRKPIDVPFEPPDDLWEALGDALK